MNKYNIGEKVRINLDKVGDDFKKYDGVYTIEKIMYTTEKIYVYKLKGVPQIGTEDMIERVE